jgi:hypothetical protein
VPAGGSSLFWSLLSFRAPFPAVCCRAPPPGASPAPAWGWIRRTGTATLTPPGRVGQEARPRGSRSLSHWRAEPIFRLRRRRDRTVECVGGGHFAAGGPENPAPARRPGTPHSRPPHPHRRPRAVGPAPASIHGLPRPRRGTWACYLVTFQEASGGWRGFFAFRPGHARRSATRSTPPTSSSRMPRGRSTGRPGGSAAPSWRGSSRRPSTPASARDARRLRFGTGSRTCCAATRGSRARPGTPPQAERTLAELRSLYDSYRIDQVVHLITLVDPPDFQEAVNRILDGRTFDFSAKDRLQFAMMVVDHLERLLPLPPSRSGPRTTWRTPSLPGLQPRAPPGGAGGLSPPPMPAHALRGSDEGAIFRILDSVCYSQPEGR